MQTPDEARDQEPAGLSRRGLIQGAAGVGAAAVAAGFLASALAQPATAATDPASSAAGGPAVGVGEPLVAHVRDARTGDVDLFVGARHIRVRDTELATRLARAATSRPAS